MPLSKWIHVLCSVVLSLSFAAPRPVYAEESAGQAMERIYSKQYEWLLYCDLEPLPKYMIYKGSQMSPVARFNVGYQLTLHMQRNQTPPPPLRYEELWYANRKCVGMKRFNDIWPGPLQQGAIYFRCMGDNSLSNYDREMASCCIRMIMDIYAKRSIMAGVLVPINCFDQFASDITLYNFFLLEEASGGKGENLSLHLMSYPRGKDKYYYYDDTGRR
jgi:hypothetical protein